MCFKHEPVDGDQELYCNKCSSALQALSTTVQDSSDENANGREKNDDAATRKAKKAHKKAANRRRERPEEMQGVGDVGNEPTLRCQKSTSAVRAKECRDRQNQQW